MSGAPADAAPSRIVLIALGSNLGDRAAHLAAARAHLALLPETSLVAASAVEETAPLGDVEQPAYLNQMVAVRTPLEAPALLEALHGIERRRGRERRERWGSRTLDLDIVEIDGETRDDVPPIVPHPGLAARDFWQRERAELRSIMRTMPPSSAVMRGPLADRLGLPAWAVADEARCAHIQRVVELLDRWALEMQLDPIERAAWRDAGRFHDALRDADDAQLGAIVGESDFPRHALHGPAAAALLAAAGEQRADVLDAITHHTLGHAGWGRTGRALYMADYLEPGRRFGTADHAVLADRVPVAFDDVFAEVVMQRVRRADDDGCELHARTRALLEAVT